MKHICRARIGIQPITICISYYKQRSTCRIFGPYAMVNVYDTDCKATPLDQDLRLPSGNDGCHEYRREECFSRQLFLHVDFVKHPYLSLPAGGDGRLLKLSGRRTLILSIFDYVPPWEVGFIAFLAQLAPIGTPWDREKMMKRDISAFEGRLAEALILTGKYFAEAGTTETSLVSQANEAGELNDGCEIYRSTDVRVEQMEIEFSNDAGVVPEGLYLPAVPKYGLRRDGVRRNSDSSHFNIYFLNSPTLGKATYNLVTNLRRPPHC